MRGALLCRRCSGSIRARRAGWRKSGRGGRGGGSSGAVAVARGSLDVVCKAGGAGLYDPAPEVGCTIIGSAGMHMRLASTADAVTLNAEATGYTMPFPVPGHYAQMQSNMAATLHIDLFTGFT